jgi:hypothetical protein
MRAVSSHERHLNDRNKAGSSLTGFGQASDQLKGSSEEEEDRLSGASSVGDGSQRRHQDGSIKQFYQKSLSRSVGSAILSPIVDRHPGSKGLGLV